MCIPNPCYNGGVCLSSATSFICSCKSPYVGRLCEIVQTTTVAPAFTSPGMLIGTRVEIYRLKVLFSSNKTYMC